MKKSWDFPGGPVVKNLRLQCRGRGLYPWPGNQDPMCCAVWPKKKKNNQTNKQTKFMRKSL